MTKKTPFPACVPDTVDVAAIRKSLGLSQRGFAAQFGFPVTTIRDYEQGRHAPDSSTRAYLRVIEREPDAVIRALSAE